MTRAEFIKKQTKALTKIIRDCQETITVAESWADNRPEEAPLDCEPERVLMSKAKAALAALEAWDMPTYGRLSVEMAAYAKRTVAEGHHS